jgi:hypothetical protein
VTAAVTGDDGRRPDPLAGIRTSKEDELRVVRQPLPRRDQAEKVAGGTRYAGDLAFARMLHARLVRSPVPSARITGRDASAALAVRRNGFSSPPRGKRVLSGLSTRVITWSVSSVPARGHRKGYGSSGSVT